MKRQRISKPHGTPWGKAGQWQMPRTPLLPAWQQRLETLDPSTGKSCHAGWARCGALTTSSEAKMVKLKPQTGLTPNPAVTCGNTYLAGIGSDGHRPAAAATGRHRRSHAGTGGHTWARLGSFSAKRPVAPQPALTPRQTGPHSAVSRQGSLARQCKHARQTPRLDAVVSLEIGRAHV